MVEIGARAMLAVHDITEGQGGGWDALRPEWQKVYRASARAVIEALMEPTKPMLFFGMDAMARDDLEPTEDEFRAGFIAALRAALGDQFAALSQPNEEGEGK